jgi:hypothetical protein
MKMMDLIYADQPADTIIDFIKFAINHLGLKSFPKISLLKKHVASAESNSFAAYRPTSKSIVLYVKHRHIMDILRSLAHELVHFKQDLENRLDHKSGKTGSEEENEAHALAGQIMRIYGKKHPELF